MTRTELNQRLPAVVDALVRSSLADPRMQHLNRILLPRRDVVIESIKRLRQLVFPGYFGEHELTTGNVTYRIGDLVMELSDMLYEQVRISLRYARGIPGASGGNGSSEECDRRAGEVVAAFFDRLPAVRQMLAEDVQAAFDGDPAAKNTDEIILSYPGVFAIFVQRLAHELHVQGVPLVPRIMTEYAHSLTGIDIHPGARLGRRLFIDHGTGVVIGETTEIGPNVKIYQGVTLGALAPHFGQALRGQKRHPTIEEDVTIYAGTTILGGDTVIGKSAVVGGNLFITASIPPFTQVSMDAPKLKYRERRPRGAKAEFVLDFSI